MQNQIRIAKKICCCITEIIIPPMGYYNFAIEPQNFMTFSTHFHNQPALATLGVKWLVLVLITFGMIVSSIGMTSSHSIATVAASHESVQPSSVDPHGHVHADQGIEFLVADESSNGAHPHHSMDHSHETGHHLPLAWGVIASQLPSWEVMLRPVIETGRAFRLDRPPMG